MTLRLDKKFSNRGNTLKFQEVLVMILNDVLSVKTGQKLDPHLGDL